MTGGGRLSLPAIPVGPMEFCAQHLEKLARERAVQVVHNQHMDGNPRSYPAHDGALLVLRMDQRAAHYRALMKAYAGGEHALAILMEDTSEAGAKRALAMLQHAMRG
jgi:hypothetical protein